MSLPSLKDACASQNALFSALSILLEPSSSLQKPLVPALSASLSRTPPGSYAGLIDSAEREVGSWSQEDKADFLGGHPRIGEVKNLSAHSSKEQDNSQTTPPKVLAKLETLNALYESRYPTLKYVTFVAGGSRAQVAKDMEQVLMEGPIEKDTEGIEASPTVTHPVGSKEWIVELERGRTDVFKIAHARLNTAS